MNKREYSSFIPKWARDGRDYMGEFPPIGVPNEDAQMDEPNILAEFIEEQRASRAAFETEIRRKIQNLNRHNRTAWFYGAIGWIAAAILAVVLTEVTR